MNIDVWLWVLQALCAAIFLGTGTMKLTLGREALAQRFAWTASTSLPLVWGIGALEVLGALGLVLPELTRIFAFLTPLSALGLALTMIGATATNLRFRHHPALALSVPLLFVCGFIAWGRFALAPV